MYSNTVKKKRRKKKKKVGKRIDIYAIRMLISPRSSCSLEYFIKEWPPHAPTLQPYLLQLTLCWDVVPAG